MTLRRLSVVFLHRDLSETGNFDEDMKIEMLNSRRDCYHFLHRVGKAPHDLGDVACIISSSVEESTKGPQDRLPNTETVDPRMASARRSSQTLPRHVWVA